MVERFSALDSLKQGRSLSTRNCDTISWVTSREDMVYQVVAARRLQWDNLVWQVPALCLTAQAFLFTIAIGGTTSRLARIIASVLALLITVLCTTLMARHRQSEIHDANWLARFEGVEWKTEPASRRRT